MAITRVGTESDGDSSAIGATTISFSHTTPVGATLLLLAVHMQGDESIDTTPTFDGDNFTLIHDSGVQTGGDQRAWLYGFVSPAAKTATIAATTSGHDFHGAAAVNFAGTKTASVAAATNFLSADVNTVNGTTNVHASAGSAGNALIVTAGWRGGDITPSTVDNSFAEIYDRATGASASADTSHTMSELLNAAPSAVTITMGGSDQNSGILIELVAASEGIAPQAVYHYQNEGYF